MAGMHHLFSNGWVQPEETVALSINKRYEVTSRENKISIGILKSGKMINYEGELKSKSGRKTPFQVNVRKVVFEEAESLQWLMRDITARKDLDSLREELTFMIYHDLRSPLANIVSGLDILSTMFPGPENETIQSVTGIARRSTDHIQRLVSSLLDINRLESGYPIVSKQAVTPAMLAKDAIDAVRPMAESRHQVLTSQISEKLFPVWVDVDMVRRVFINLMENASKFTELEGKIEIGAKQEGGWVQFWVQDNGPGIPFTEQEHIFEKYARLRGQASASVLGIGLAFCRLVINGHGGKIWVESAVGKGSKFMLTLPVAHEKYHIQEKACSQ